MISPTQRTKRLVPVIDYSAIELEIYDSEAVFYLKMNEDFDPELQQIENLKKVSNLLMHLFEKITLEVNCKV